MCYCSLLLRYFYFVLVYIEYLIYFQILSKKHLFGSENRNEELKITPSCAKNIYDVLCKGLFSHIMSKARKNLGTAMLFTSL